jgi:hypothetical protein
VETFLLTVERTHSDEVGLRLWPGIRLSQCSNRPTVAGMMQGSKLKLLRPDGTIGHATLVIYGVSLWRGADGDLYTNEDLSDPEILLTISDDKSAQGVPVGTEIWLID